TTYDVQVTGRGNVPSGAGAVVLNVTAAKPASGPLSDGYLMVFPTGARPAQDTSNLNFAATDVAVPNLVVAPVGTGGKVSVFNKYGNTEVIFDVMGWFPAGGAVNRMTPARILDTRSDQTGVVDDFNAALGPNGTYDVQVAGRGGLPTVGVGAVILNVTAVKPASGPLAEGYLMVFPTGNRPAQDTSNLNFSGTDMAIPNLVIAPVGANGKVSVFNKYGNTEVIFDVMGWFPAGGVFHPVTPARVLDTRADQTGVIDDYNAPLGPDGIDDVLVHTRGGVPNTAGAVILNVTAVKPASGPLSPGYLMVFPTGNRPASDTSNVNFFPGDLAVPNAVISPIGSGGRVSVLNKYGTTEVIFDVMGYFPA
ncbi:MAG: hypothetical protein H0W70_08115, partial [Actinobacteria bacterium]|nr:hypothetical protein [Actinomycetota bacterium]